ncbi:MAG: hypothetical protein HQM08_29695 [Candidatus Riflebacteria bacterium]|nr:hypothetical protein [Candidatus Riflebacteria bacterium]
MQRLISWRRGQALVEFALVLSLGGLLFFGGLVEFGFLMNNLLSLQRLNDYIAQKVALLSTCPSATTIQSGISNSYDALYPCVSLDPAKISVQVLTTTLSTPSSATSELRSVQLTYTSPLITPMFQAISTYVPIITGAGYVH